MYRERSAEFVGVLYFVNKIGTTLEGEDPLICKIQPALLKKRRLTAATDR